MTDHAVSDTLYRAADYIREHGFSFDLGDYECPRCLIGAIYSAVSDKSLTPISRASHLESERRVREIVDVQADALKRDGWTANDAIAALEIAADIAYAEGR